MSYVLRKTVTLSLQMPPLLSLEQKKKFSSKNNPFFPFRGMCPPGLQPVAVNHECSLRNCSSRPQIIPISHFQPTYHPHFPPTDHPYFPFPANISSPFPSHRSSPFPFPTHRSSPFPTHRSSPFPNLLGRRKHSEQRSQLLDGWKQKQANALFQYF